MTKVRHEWKVGLFVLVSLTMMAAAVIRFSKGSPMFAQTVELRMRASNVGGIIPGAVVLMVGVPIGHVSDTQVDKDGRSVTIFLKIQKKYEIHGDAQFSIKQSGLLGDRYVSVVPTENKSPVLIDGAEVKGEGPLDLEEITKSAVGLLQRVDDTSKKLGATVARIDRILFNERTLTNLSEIVANFHLISERALATLDGMNRFVRTNTRPMNATVSNLAVFSGQLNEVAVELRELVATNRSDVTGAIKNIESSTMQIDRLTSDLLAGKGVIGNLLKNEELETEFLSAMRNLSNLSSNLNKHGLLWKPKFSRTSAIDSLYTGRNPNR